MSRGETKRVQELKHKARRRSIKEGLSNTIKNSFATEYVSPFAIAINSSGAMVSMISSVSGLLGPLSQMFSPKLMEKYSRKKIVLTEVIYESLSLLPFIAIALLYYFDIWREYLPFLMLLTVAVYVVFSNISYPAWFSWMGDIVDRHYRGRWFSKRRFIIGIVASVFVLISAFVLDIFRDNHIEMIGFAIFFFIAFLGRLASFKVIKKEYEPLRGVNGGLIWAAGNPYKLSFYSQTGLLGWMWILNLGIGFFNLVPLGPVDGGRMLKVGLERILKKEIAASIWKWTGITVLGIILFSLLAAFF